MSASPTKSYIVWHTQRTGSTLLCTTLEATGIAGNPQEWPGEQLGAQAPDAQSLIEQLWSQQMTPNGVLGVKWGFQSNTVDGFFRTFGDDASAHARDWSRIWAQVFPDCAHVVTTRRNKFRLAISWWKSICGGPGHLSADDLPLPWQTVTPASPDRLEQAYDFKAIKALAFEVVEREARLQDFLQRLGVVPLTVTYEDFIAHYEHTVGHVLDHIGASDALASIPEPGLVPTADAINEAWMRRFLLDLEQERDPPP